MTPEQFCYWLQGRAELQPNNPPSFDEWKMIAAHLQLVFEKRTATKTLTLSDLSKTGDGATLPNMPFSPEITQSVFKNNQTVEIGPKAYC